MTIYVYWGIATAAFLIICCLLGLRTAKGPLGILLDTRNRMSLSQLQMVVWTGLILCPLAAAAVHHWSANIELDPTVWGLMGISVGSLFSSITVKAQKRAKAPAGSGPKLRSSESLQGIQVVNANPGDARFVDMFTGEEASDNTAIDIGKVQMFFVSVTLWIAYGAMIWNSLGTLDVGDAGRIAFPELSTTMIALLGISHAGYVTVKAVDKTPTAAP